jgi:multimeric flavodoxin WrbA
MSGRCLLLVGSGKKPRSNSASLGAYLLGRLAGRGVETLTLNIPRCLLSAGGTSELLARARDSELVVLSAPLYWDSLPAAAVRAMELLAAQRKEAPPNGEQRFAAVINSGFPEASQSATALAICRRFAAETGFRWAGGLAMGGGEVLGGRPLAETGGRGRSARRALDLAAEALAEGRDIPEEAVRLMARPVAPAWLYAVAGQWGWRRQAKRFGAQKRIHARPYQTD